MITPFRSRVRAGFTLAEVLVSSVLIVMVMGFLFVTVDQTRRTITSTTSKVAQFQAARVAFDAMTRNLAQATLNTYYDYDRDAEGNPTRYRRQSDLHFLSGPSEKREDIGWPGLVVKRNSKAIYPTHAVFFQAPLGFTSLEKRAAQNKTEETRYYKDLSNLMTAVGYYIAWDEDELIPEVLKTAELIPKRYRYRLMQVMQPAELLMVYNNSNYTNLPGLGNAANPAYTSPTDWIKVAIGERPTPQTGLFPTDAEAPPRTLDSSRVLAENIVALIITPKVAERDREERTKLNDLSDDYTYDSRRAPAYLVQARDTSRIPPGKQDVQRELDKLDKKYRRQLHQLPPILQVTMVAIDEQSGMKLEDYAKSRGNVPPDWTTSLFKEMNTYDSFLKDLGDPASLENNSLIYQISNPDGTLPTPRMNYRVFTTDIVLRGSKWSSTLKDTP